MDRNNSLLFYEVLGKVSICMNQVEVTKLTTIQTKSKKVLAVKQIDSLQEITRRMKASSQTTALDPIIYRKLAHISKN